VDVTGLTLMSGQAQRFPRQVSQEIKGFCWLMTGPAENRRSAREVARKPATLPTSPQSALQTEKCSILLSCKPAILILWQQKRLFIPVCRSCAREALAFLRGAWHYWCTPESTSLGIRHPNHQPVSSPYVMGVTARGDDSIVISPSWSDVPHKEHLPQLQDQRTCAGAARPTALSCWTLVVWPAEETKEAPKAVIDA